MLNIDKETSNKTFTNLFHELQDDGLSYSASSSILSTKNSRLMKFDFNSIPETDKLTFSLTWNDKATKLSLEIFFISYDILNSLLFK